ncbi:MAG: CooT family nickel-binding protein [Anaerolineales bacterium]
MCQAKVVMRRDGHEDVIMQDVIQLRVEGERIWLTRFFEDPIPVQGRLVEADFLKHTVTLIPLAGKEG